MRWRALLLAVLFGAGCDRSKQLEPVAPPATSTTLAAPAIGPRAASIGGSPVTLAEVDASIRLRLYDLDRARHALRAAALRQLLMTRVLGPAAAAGQRDAAFVAAAFERAGVEIDLKAPEPPILDVSIDDDPVRGPADAPVTIVMFCDYQSPYCRRMQPVLHRLLRQYAPSVRLVARDFPQPTHRDAVGAAEAAQCAGEQGRYWAYHDVLLQEQADLGRPALERYADRIHLDAARFQACLDEHRMQAEVAADAADARRLGVSVVPTTFVDGRYFRGPQTFDVLRAEVEAALGRRGIAPPVAAAGGAVGSGADANEPAAASTITLARADVQRALAQGAALGRDLERPAYDLGPGYEGRGIVRVARVTPGSLYDTMGLHPGDVIVTVNGAVVLDGGDALFGALRDHGTVTVRLLRRGLPQTFEYRIE
jgi:protein-disulfide isomerase